MTKLTKYTFTGSGVSLTAVCVVLAEDRLKALELARELMTGSIHPAYQADEVDLTGKPQVVYFWDGDY